MWIELQKKLKKQLKVKNQKKKERNKFKNYKNNQYHHFRDIRNREISSRTTKTTNITKAGNTNPKLIQEVYKLYKELYDIDGANMIIIIMMLKK